MSWSHIALAAALGHRPDHRSQRPRAGRGPRVPRPARGFPERRDARTARARDLRAERPGPGLGAGARGPGAALRRVPLILSGGILLIALAAAAGQLLSSTSGGGSGGSDGSGRSTRRAGPPKTGLAAAVCDVDLRGRPWAAAPRRPALTRQPDHAPRVDVLGTGPAGTVTLTVAPRARAGLWADPTAASPLALAGDARWVVRTTAYPSDGHEVDQPALQQPPTTATRSTKPRSSTGACAPRARPPAVEDFTH